MDDSFRHRIDKFVGVDKPPTLAISAFETAEFVATRVRWEKTEAGHLTQFDRADGYMICLQRCNIPAQPYWADQLPMSLPPIRRGQFLFLDLNVQHSSLVPSGVDCISIFISRDVLLKFQAESELVPNGLLRAPLGATHEDHVIRHLGETLMPAIEQQHDGSQLYVDHVAIAMLSRLTTNFGTDAPPAAPVRGGLAAWQERRAKEILMAHFDGSIGLEAIATECRLSRSHFARAFKISTGSSPLRWLTIQRIERAKELLLKSDLSVENIAYACGFANGSHLTRAFLQTTSLPPGTWRRLRRF